MEPDAVLRYGAHDDAILDLHLPPGFTPGGRAVPVLLLIHGGFWRVAYDRTHTRPMARALADHGLVVATPEYRRVGGDGELAGGWPTTCDDLTAAATALPGLLGQRGVTVGRLTVMGHSAGGHLALWLATTLDARGPRIDRAVALAPVADLRAGARDRLGDGAVQAFLGGEPTAVPERYDAADPATLLAARPRAEVVVVHGEDDDIVPVSQAAGLAARHPWVRLTTLPGADHFAVITPGSPAWATVVAAAHDGG